MAKKVACVTLHKKKPVKRRRSRLRTVFQQFFNYMKSDTFMFSPLIDPKSSATFSAASLGFDEPIKKKEKKMVQVLEEYLKCDCYMYAPVVSDSAMETTSAPTGVHVQGKQNHGIHDLIGKRNEKPMDGGNRIDSFREIVCDDSYTPIERIAIKHALAPKEAVKRVVHQNCRPTSRPGKGFLPKEARKIVVE